MTKPSQPSASLELITRKKNQPYFWAMEEKNTYRLGRGKANDIVLPFNWVSRQHAMLQMEDNGCFNLIDLGSSNGTWVNKKRIYTPTRLKTKDQIKIGDSILFFLQKKSQKQPSLTDVETEPEDDQTVAFIQTELVTILVCDIRGFTNLSEELGETRISQLLGYWTKKVNELVLKNGGQVDKFIGDAVMAVWTEESDYKNILQALKTVMEISLFSRKLGEKVPFLKHPLKIGAALNTGRAAMGNMGVDGQRDYTIVGDVVNVTFRLEEMTVPDMFDVILGSETYTHLPGASKCFQSREYKVRGKSKEIVAYGGSLPDLFQYLKRMTPSTQTK
ncbi:MAG: adenylate/guanylate cyclase domain-containing protein [Thermodesulfobacteriota bacterium]|nr:adenylate/guanylate cyclase domain-containing protein [Thermodesulfobacteriota bacterium]